MLPARVTLLGSAVDPEMHGTHLPRALTGTSVQPHHPLPGLERLGRESARALLQPVFEQLVEGSDTADLKAAERLLATLG